MQYKKNNNNPCLLVADTCSKHNQSYNKLPCMTALNNTTQTTNYIETK